MSGTDGRILLRPRVLARNATDDGNPVLYRRAGKAVRIGLDDDDALAIQPITMSVMLHRLSEVAAWYITNSKGEVYDHHPAKQVAGYLTDALPQQFPVIKGIKHAPEMLPGPELVDATGYDRRSRSYHVIPAGLREMPIREAMETMEYVFGEFPFDAGVNPESPDWCNWIGFLITCLTRSAYPTAPMCLIGKPMNRIGATLLGKLGSIIATGTTPPFAMIRGDKKDPAEAGKALMSALTAANNRGITMLDNLSGTVDSASLAAFLTTDAWNDRRLGFNDQHILLPSRYHTLLATTNNGQFTEELVKRTYFVCLDAKVPEPENRTFRIPNIERYVSAHRDELLSCVWSLITAWAYTDAPLLTNQRGMGGYEEWRDTVGGILHNSGLTGFLGNRQSFESKSRSDSEADFVAAWLAAQGEATVTTGQLLAIAIGEAGEAALLDIGGADDKAKATSLGRKLGKMTGKVYRIDDRSVRVEAAKRSSRSKQWKLVIGQQLAAAK